MGKHKTPTSDSIDLSMFAKPDLTDDELLEYAKLMREKLTGTSESKKSEKKPRKKKAVPNKAVVLSSEQEDMITIALSGKNVLVDACIGSGKTTTIQQLCNQIPTSKRILYLTYNKLLKIDAKSKIKRGNCIVQNYHGFASYCLRRMHANISVGISELIQTFNKLQPDVRGYDVLIVDEYQDIELEHAVMLEYIKWSNPRLQIVMVGDMKQKIYDKTTLDVFPFVNDFLGEHETLAFTKCFRISAEHAAMLGRVWNKEINGVNPDCQIKYMDETDVVTFLSQKDPSQVLCLGSIKGNGSMSKVLNRLEWCCPEKFNKNTVYASIEDSDRTIAPPETAAIFTTFDSSKGLERDICVVFDFTIEYWMTRRNQKGQKYEILRNIFCVAASRGKQQIIFVKNGENNMLTEDVLSDCSQEVLQFKDVNISEMFDFKYIEDVEECYRLLNVTKRDRKDISVIDIDAADGLIDLSPCIGIYQEACFFENYSMEKQYDMFQRTHPDRAVFDFSKVEKKSLDDQILRLIALETGQERYVRQARKPFVKSDELLRIRERLSSVFRRSDDSQVYCELPFCDGNPDSEILIAEHGSAQGGFLAMGYADVVKNNTVYELKFVSELQHSHFLQCAAYMTALNIKKGVLWNVRNNEMYEITIPDTRKFLDCVARTITKHEYSRYIAPDKILKL